MKIQYLGHSCFMVEIKGKKLLFDPFITGNPMAKHIDITKLQPDFILVSHGHTDHILDCIAIAKNSKAIVVSNFEVINWLISKGVTNTHSMNIGGKYKFEYGFVKYFNAAHSSSMPDGSYGGSPGGFIIESEEGNFYFAGDTGLFSDMKLIGEFLSINFAILPIGNNFTMGPDNAIIASGMINCDTIIGMHYDTFPSIEINKELALDKFNRAGKNLILLKIGETFNFEK
jgi:L-ascorbate metabolism protein UlaG (beta-lactamase superfamily)